VRVRKVRGDGEGWMKRRGIVAGEGIEDGPEIG
jgi:hypothetical protein